MAKSMFEKTMAKLVHIQQNKLETACDIETPGKGVRIVTAIGFTIGGPEEAVVVPMNGRYFSPHQEEELWGVTRRILATCPVIGQNFLFDWDVLTDYGVQDVWLSWDTMVVQHLLYTDLPRGLDALVAQYLDRLPHKHMIGEDLDLYNGLDCCTTHEVRQKQSEEIQAQGEPYAQMDLEQVHMLSDLHRVLLTIQKRGFRVDQDQMATAREEMLKRADQMEEELEELVGQKLNPRSTEQLKKYYYSELGIKPYINKQTKRPRVDDDALQRLARKGYASAQKIRDIREVRNVVDKYFRMELDEDGRARCQIRVTGTATGRLATAKTLAGTGTNLQNLPPEFGKCIIPDEGHIFVEVDLDQAEKRLVALITQDERNIQDFKDGVDIHSMELARVWNVPVGEITKEQRNKIGKPLNHMTSYGVKAETFSANIGVPTSEGRKILNRYYHQEHPQLNDFFNQVKHHLKNDSVTMRNLFGRPRRFLGAKDDTEMRSAYDFIPQSTIGEICNRALLYLLDNAPSYVQLMMQVHDSNLVQIPDTEEHLQEVWPILEHAMHYTFTYGDYTLDVPTEFTLMTAWNKKNGVEVEENTPEAFSKAYRQLKEGCL